MCHLLTVTTALSHYKFGIMGNINHAAGPPCERKRLWSYRAQCNVVSDAVTWLRCRSVSDIRLQRLDGLIVGDRYSPIDSSSVYIARLPPARQHYINDSVAEWDVLVVVVVLVYGAHARAVVRREYALPAPWRRPSALLNTRHSVRNTNNNNNNNNNNNRIQYLI